MPGLSPSTRERGFEGKPALQNKVDEFRRENRGSLQLCDKKCKGVLKGKSPKDFNCDQFCPELVAHNTKVAKENEEKQVRALAEERMKKERDKFEIEKLGILEEKWRALEEERTKHKAFLDDVTAASAHQKRKLELSQKAQEQGKAHAERLILAHNKCEESLSQQSSLCATEIKVLREQVNKKLAECEGRLQTSRKEAKKDCESKLQTLAIRLVDKEAANQTLTHQNKVLLEYLWGFQHHVQNLLHVQLA